MNKILLFLSFFICGGIGLSAQQNQSEKCAFDRLHQELLKQPIVQKAIKKNRRQIEEYKNSTASRSSAITTIPVVVHVFHCGEAIGAMGSGGGIGANLPTAQITSAIANLNNAFAHTGIYADGMHNGYTANTDARFTLASTAPDGSATNGIIRVNLSGQPWGATYCSQGMDAGQGGGVAENTVKAVSVWPASDYMNVWLVHKIENGGTCSGTLGFASFPGTTPGTTDGLTVLSGAFGYDPSGALYPNTLCPSVNLNGTADHEVGHYLNLHHTFNGDNGGAVCPPTGAGAGDECGDIPPHKRSSGCPSDMTTGNTCDSNGPNPYIHNFMDYVDDNCYHGFSGDQKIRIDASIASTGPRAALGTSKGDDAPTGSYPNVSVSCYPTIANLGSGGIATASLNGVTWISSSSGLDGGNVNRVASQEKAGLIQGSSYTLSVGMISSSYCNVYIDYNDDGDFGDVNEMVHDSPSALTSHSIAITPPIGGGVTLNKKIRMRIIADGSDVTGPCNALTDGQAEDYSVEIAIMALPIELVTFKAESSNRSILLEWSTLSELNNKGFEVQRSMNPSNGFESIIWIDGNGSASETSEYYHIDRNILTDQTYYYRLLQMDYDGRKELSNIVSAKIKSQGLTVKLVPNPATEQTQIILNSSNKTTVSVELISTDGRILMKRLVSAEEKNSIILELSEFPKGLYFVKLTQNDMVNIERLVKN